MVLDKNSIVSASWNLQTHKIMMSLREKNNDDTQRSDFTKEMNKSQTFPREGLCQRKPVLRRSEEPVV